MKRIIRFFDVEDWKKGCALVILYAYAYQLCGWPMLFWVSTMVTVWTGLQIPAPPLLPWEFLATGSGNLALIGGLEAWKGKNLPSANPS